MKKKKICFVTVDCSPEYLGGYSLYHQNLIKYIKNKKNIKISWVYFGKENKKYFKEDVEYFEIKKNKLKSFTWIWNSFSLSRFFKKNNFEIINSTIGLSDFFYKKKKNQKIIQTFHGTAYFFNKNHFERFDEKGAPPSNDAGFGLKNYPCHGKNQQWTPALGSVH